MSRINRRAAWAMLALACSSYAVLYVFGWYPARRSGGYGPDFFQALMWELLRWNLWLPAGALLMRWERRRPHGLVRSASACLAAAAAHTLALLILYAPLLGHALVPFLRYRWFAPLHDFATGLVVSSLVLGFTRMRNHELRASTLEAQLALAQLEALRMQLHPHFLFNTLNAISALQLADPQTAQRMTVRLADFLRLTLENSHVQQVSLRREVEFLSCYLEIERLRFGKRLTVDMDIAPETLATQVPNLILQPLVENAVRHGIGARAAAGRIEIQSSRSNGSLQLRVRDSGPGLRGEKPLEGIGLGNTRARLAALYGSASHMILEDAPDGGFQVAITMPWVTAE